MKNRVKTWIKKSLVGRYVFRLYHHTRGYWGFVLLSYAQLREEVFFVQVGAHDGFHGDALAKVLDSRPKWRGVLVEPVRYLFERLVANQEHNASRLKFENAAIAPENGFRKFYRLMQSDQPGLLPGTISWARSGKKLC